MEVCGSAHHWGRLLRELGHEVKLIAAQFARPFVKTNNTDAADAQAIWEAVQRPGMRFVAVKSQEQQAVLSLHRIRAQIVKIRTMPAHQIRSLIYEFGVVVPKGWRALLGSSIGRPSPRDAGPSFSLLVPSAQSISICEKRVVAS